MGYLNERAIFDFSTNTLPIIYTDTGLTESYNTYLWEQATH